MKKLSKHDAERQAALVAELKDKAAAVKVAVEAYNETVDKAQAFVEDMFQSADGYFDDRSTSWQESERGEAYCEWRDSWGVHFEKIELGDVNDSADALDAVNTAPMEV